SLAFALLAVALPWLAADPRTRPRLREVPGVGAAVAIVAAAVALAVGWAWRISSGVGEALTRESVATSIGETAPFTHQSIGVFGEGDAPLPSGLWQPWLATVLLLVVVGLARGSARQRLAILAAVGATLAVPVVAQAMAIAPVGARWNGRYQLPATVLVAVVAAGAIGVRRRDRSWLAALVVVTCTVQVGAAYVVARRYAVGTEGPVWFLGEDTWRAAWVSAALLLAFAVAWALACVRTLRLLSTPGHSSLREKELAASTQTRTTQTTAHVR
ncbi:MAG TPA: hypothetical protein VHK88_02665, partial [Aquihabitans sp.]|nr:hypothetical protein [Aquihabitans sp.]